MVELETLLKQRDAYAGKILKLAILIAIIFLVPAVSAMLVTRFFGISYVYTLGTAVAVSWVFVIIVYTRTSRRIQLLEKRIKDLRDSKEHKNNQHTITTL